MSKKHLAHTQAVVNGKVASLNGHYKLSEIWATREALNTLLSPMGLQAKVSIQIARLVRTLSPELDTINKIHNELIKKYGEEVEDGNFKVDGNSPQFTAFSKEFIEVLEQEIMLNISPIHLPGNLLIDAGTLLKMGPFVDVEESRD